MFVVVPKRIAITQIITHLLENGGLVDALDSDGLTPLMYAVHKDRGDATALLCDYGADVSCYCKRNDYQHRTGNEKGLQLYYNK